MVKIGQNWGKIANYPPNAQHKSASLQVANVCSVCVLYFDVRTLILTFLLLFLHCAVAQKGGHFLKKGQILLKKNL